MPPAIVIGDRQWPETPAPLPFQWAAAYGWCVRCERAYPAIAWVENNWQCPTRSCEGTFDDAWEWTSESVLLAKHPEYPKIPDEGEEYPL